MLLLNPDGASFELSGFAVTAINHPFVERNARSRNGRQRESVTLRPVNQSVLDTCLTHNDPGAQGRFSCVTGDALVIDGSTGRLHERHARGSRRVP
ncbi:hypothetical protein H0B56_02990 [Haloechinothrix sp. YIM 98757]|uniref:Uncharacterized protein n=1 Tax=Haloechinothrix aidingensis TaxID=2752311 RepID=A0A838A808_9PSEU|nr:hypothetical protein [Haloechinothrix aidingensis]MBA0124499.1 hypothetical protein [Haloechinothrix aidingensis]